MTCVLFYRPPKYNKDFIQEFGTFRSNIVPTVDKLLILVDINIHVCCLSHYLVKEFMQLIDSFDLVQHINEPTHTQGHTIYILAFQYVTSVLRKSVCLIICLSSLNYYHMGEVHKSQYYSHMGKLWPNTNRVGLVIERL